MFSYLGRKHVQLNLFMYKFFGYSKYDRIICNAEDDYYGQNTYPLISSQ